MYQTLIISSDDFLNTYFKSLTVWKKYEFTILDLVHDAHQAIEILEYTTPDYIMMDISNSPQEGFDFIEKIRKTNRKSYITIMSNHAEHVKQSMDLSVNEYVLKNTLNKEFLEIHLAKAARYLEKQRLAEENRKIAEHLKGMDCLKIKKKYIKKSILNETISKDLREKASECGLSDYSKEVSAIVLFLKSWGVIKSEISKNEYESYFQAFREVMADSLCNTLQVVTGIEVVYLEKGTFACMIDHEGKKNYADMAKVTNYIAQILNRLANDEPYDYQIGISRICTGELNMRKSFLQGREAIRSGFYDITDIVHYKPGLKMSRSLPPAALAFKNMLKNNSTKKNEAEFGLSFMAAIDAFNQERTEPSAVKTWIKEIDHLLGIKRSASERGNIIDINDVIQLWSHYFEVLFEKKPPESTKEISPAVKEAVSYIKEHFREPLGLTDVAEDVHLNATYFSYLFKQELGMGFSHYLLSCRVNYAKHLLTTTDKKVKEIATEAGFNDYQYFSKAFKKKTGQSPMEYRRCGGNDADKHI